MLTVAANAVLRWRSSHSCRRPSCRPLSHHAVSTTSWSRACPPQLTPAHTPVHSTPATWTRKSVSSSACAVRTSFTTPTPSCDVISGSVAILVTCVLHAFPTMRRRLVCVSQVNERNHILFVSFMTKLPILPCAEKLELVLSIASVGITRNSPGDEILERDIALFRYPSCV